MNLTGRPITQKQGKPVKDRAHLLRVKSLPCIICNAPPPSDAHHCISDRYGTRKVGDDATIPLCRTCHLEGPDAIHNGKASWEAKHGKDYDFLPRVKLMLDAM